MLVSIIIPVYNSSKTIHRCIESVVISVEKVTNDYEIICIDDGSVDDSLQELKEIAANNNKIIVLHQENAGAATARNRGLEIAKGDFIAFNDSDDEWTHTHLAMLLKVFRDYPNIDCVCANHEEDKQSTFFLDSVDNDLYRITLNSQQFKNRFSPPTSVFRKKILESGIRFESTLHGSEEFYFFNHILYHFNCVLLNKKVSQSITHKKRFGQNGLSGNLKEMERGELYSIRDAKNHLGVNPIVCLFAIIFSLLKYLRRVLIVKFRSISN